MSNTGKIIRVNALPPIEERENNVIYQVAAPGAATYTDYAIDENGDVKTAAPFFNPEDFMDSGIHISAQDVLEEGIKTQKDFNINIRERIKAKLDKPSANGTALEYPNVLGLDDNGNTATLPAGDLGKNVANSALTSVQGSGLTLGADWALETSGHPYSISGLNNVSNDSTFNTLLTQNAAGRVAKSNGKGAFLALPNMLSESEKTTWKTVMNGGWATGTMSVGIITPPIVDRKDRPSWMVLKGSGLNLNPTNFAIDVMANDGTTVIANIPNEQVQLYTSGLDLVFWFNFKDIPEGSYKLRLRNGVATYTTGVNTTISVVNSMSYIDPNVITWDKKAYTEGEENNILNASGGSVSYSAKNTNKGYAYEPSNIVAAVKSSQIARVDENFLLSMSMNTYDPQGNIGTKIYSAFFGLMPNVPLMLSNQLSTQIIRNNVTGSNTYTTQVYLNVANKENMIFAGYGESMNAATFNVIFMRNSNILTILMQFNNQARILTKSDDGSAKHIGMFLSNGAGGTTSGLNIESYYKF